MISETHLEQNSKITRYPEMTLELTTIVSLMNPAAVFVTVVIES